MTGPEHYTEAEILLAEGESVVAEIREVRCEDRRDALGKQAHGIWLQAQVHATLALAAATSGQTVAPIECTTVYNVDELITRNLGGHRA